MDPLTFRRDRYLRSSAYHLATWSLTALVLDLQLRALSMGDPTAVMTCLVLVAGGVLTSFTHERRVTKIAGPAGAPVFAGAGRLWTVTLIAIAVGGVELVATGRPQWLFPFWTVAAGAAFAFWGGQTDFPWYFRLGLGMIAAGLLDAPATASGSPQLVLRVFVMGLALPAAAIATNRRYLWFR